MFRLADIRIHPKLLFLFLQTGLFPLLVVGYFTSDWIENSAIEESFDSLTTIQTIRRGQIENYFQKSFNDIRLLADSERIYQFHKDIFRYREDVETSSLAVKFDIKSEKYSEIVAGIQRQFQNYTTLNGYSDLYLIDADFGYVMFSVKNGEDNGESLLYGRLNNSALARIWNKVMTTGTTIISDFEPYAPADSKEVAFIGHPVTNLSGEKISVVVLRFDAELISSIIESRKGMGQTGESYLIGWLEDDENFELRSNMATMGDGKFVVGYGSDLSIQYWQDALQAGESGGRGIYTDSTGKEVLVAYDKLQIEGLNWYLISKIDKYEVTEPLRNIYRKVGMFVVFFIFLTIIWAWFLSRGFTRPILKGIEFAEAISRGEYRSEIVADRKDELGELARSLNDMAGNLREVDWLKSGKEQLDDTIRGELDPDELARRCITFFVKQFDAQLGGIYLNNDGRLELRASYAFSDRSGKFDSFSFGEGIVGQAALDGESIYITSSMEDAPPLNYGAGEKPLIHYMAVPIHSDGALAGVMLIGSMHPFGTLQKNFLDQNIAKMAILFDIASSRSRIADLLNKAQIQQEELQVTNEELEEQAIALRKSEAELQSQQEELRVTNEELEEQTRALKKSKAELLEHQEELGLINEELGKRTRALEEQKNEIWAKK